MRSSPTIRIPSPDFSSFSPDELDRLEVVLQRQVRLEQEQNQRLSGLRRTMLHLQRSIHYDQQQQQQQQAQAQAVTTTMIANSPIHLNQPFISISSSSENMQCYLCYSTIEICISAPPIHCADCQRTICRRCGNYTSPDLLTRENHHRASKWRCRLCIVRREVVRKSGSWNVTTDEEVPMHSPVRLLQKLSAYRASTASASASVSPSPSPSPQNERKSTILTESSNFFTRFWRPNSQQSSPSLNLTTSQDTTTSSSSFDQTHDLQQLQRPSDVSPNSLSLTPRPTRRISLIREVATKNPPVITSFPPPSVPMPTPLRAQPTNSSTVTDPSFEDTTSEHPNDTTSEFYSQSFDTNNDNIPSEKSEDHDLTYDERQRRIDATAVPVIPSMSSNRRMTETYHSDSLASVDANIDVSMAMDYSSTAIIHEESNENLNNSSESRKPRRSSRSGVRNSDTWVRKRALMHRGYQWTTTYEGTDMNTEPSSDSRTWNDSASLPNSSANSLNNTDQANSSSSSNAMISNCHVESADVMSLHRRRSSRRLPEIPLQLANSSGQYNHENHFTTDYPSHPIRENSLGNRSTRSKSIDSDSSVKVRSGHPKLLHTHQSLNAKTLDLSNLARQKASLVVNNTLLPQRSLDYPCIVRKAPDLSDIVRRRMLYSKISKQQGNDFSMSLERDHVPKVPRKIIIRQDNSIEIALSKPPKLRRQTLSEEYYYGCNTDAEFATVAQTTNTTSTLGLPLPSSASGLSTGDRRKTIETCENIFLHAEESSKLRARTPPSNPHRILLHRDKNDTSIRTNGLGMRIVGGQECEDGSLGCFVTSVLIGGPADVQGNIEVGDQILEFNGHSLIESTYEEVRILQDHCGDIVQLVVQHNNVRLQINNGQTLSSIEISRHFETVPRLACSLTRKRRNLPPLPPSLSSTFPKQQKRELFETVETLEVPNVKELKPILINRGRLLAQIWHDVEDMKLALTIIQASNLSLRSNGDQPYSFITGKMLFEDRGFDMFETKIIHSSNPIFNETFVFHEVETVDVLHLEVFLWDKKQYQTDKQSYHLQNNDEPDEFLGMVQLPLSEANLDDEPRWYELRDRQTRKPSTSSVTFKSSSIESGDSCRKMPPLLASKKPTATRPISRLAAQHNRKIPSTNAHHPLAKNRHSQSGSLTNTNAIGHNSNSLEDEEHEENNGRHRSIITVQSVKLKRRISKGLYKIFDIHGRRHSEIVSKSADNSPTIRPLNPPTTNHIDTEDEMELAVTVTSVGNGPAVTFEDAQITISKSPRHSIISTTHPEDTSSPTLVRPIPLQQMPIGQLMIPYISSSRHSSISGSRKSSAASYCESDDDIDRYFTFPEQRDDENNESNNVQTHTVGPGQVTPRNYENMINDFIYMGQIQLGLIVTKGLLEIDVICARGLERVIDENHHQGAAAAAKSDDMPPDTYVKTYLRTGTRRVQKRKTGTIKANFNPTYQTKLKYNACNVMGRRLQVTVWQRAGKFEKNQCIGEAFIQLDNLTLTQHTVAWYKLFREKLVESEFYDSS